MQHEKKELLHYGMNTSKKYLLLSCVYCLLLQKANSELYNSSPLTFPLIYIFMAYSIHCHISYIFEANSNRPNDFSLIEGKPNEIIQTEIEFRIHGEVE